MITPFSHFLWVSFVVAIGVTCVVSKVQAQQEGQRFCCYGDESGPSTCGCVDDILQCPGGGPGPVIWDDFWVPTKNLCCRYQNLVLAYPFYGFDDRTAVWNYVFSGSVGPAPAGEDLVNVTTLVAMANNYTACFVTKRCPCIPECAETCTHFPSDCRACASECDCPYPPIPTSKPKKIKAFSLNPQGCQTKLNPSPLNLNATKTATPLPTDSCGDQGSPCQYDPMGPCGTPPCCCAGLVCMLDDIVGCDPSQFGCTCTAC
jgi:hypothetical protein